MPKKSNEELKEFYSKTLDSIFSSVEAYLKFLKFASKFYKYEPYQIIMAYGQLPTATMLATYITWNSIGRRIKPGSKHIAVGNEGFSSQLFDVAQTEGKPLPYIWKLKDYNKADDIENIIEDEISETVYSSMETYKEQIKLQNQGSIIEGLSDSKLSELFKGLIYDSGFYSVSARCDKEDAAVFGGRGSSLDQLRYFDTMDMRCYLISLVLQVVSPILLHFEKEIKQQIIERRSQHVNFTRREQPTAGEVYIPERGVGINAGLSEGLYDGRDIRSDARNISERGIPDQVSNAPDERGIDRVSSVQAAGGQATLFDDTGAAHGSGTGAEDGRHSDTFEVSQEDREQDERDRIERRGILRDATVIDNNTEEDNYTYPVIKNIDDVDLSKYENDDVIGVDERNVLYRVSKYGGHTFLITQAYVTTWGQELGYDGRRPKAKYDIIPTIAISVTAVTVHNKKNEAVVEQQSLFGMPTVVHTDDGRELTISNGHSTEAIDFIMLQGSGFQDGKKRIYDFFQSNKKVYDRITFLIKEYGIGGVASPFHNGLKFMLDHDSTGLKYEYDDDIIHEENKLSWHKVAENISRLIRLEQYIDIAHTIYNEDEEQTIEQTEDQAQEPNVILNEKVTVNKTNEIKINYCYDSNDEIGIGGFKKKYKVNVTAIRLLKTLEYENRLATSDEQHLLAKYVGWGGMPQTFDSENKDWHDEYVELKSMLTDREYADSRASTLNAYYTSPIVIQSIYKALEGFGFKSGNILEPAMGVGNFFSLLPENMVKSKLYGVELDSITGRIAKQLYQDADVRVQGYETTDYPDDFFDVAVGNVPFGSYKVNDKRYDNNNFYIHDYFFAKTLDKVRAGGILALITSKGTLDKNNPDVRKYIAQRAELIGAIRLPNNAFRSNAGTDVTTDIVFLQKREKAIHIMPDWINLNQNEDDIPLNEYYIEHPEMLLGRMVFDQSMYGNETETALEPFEGADLESQLTTAVNNLKSNIFEVSINSDNPEIIGIPAPINVKNHTYTLYFNDDSNEERVYYRNNSIMTEVTGLSKDQESRIRAMIALRQATRDIITAQNDNCTEEELVALQDVLNETYDNFNKRCGYINSRSNENAFSEDSDYYLLCSLEKKDENVENLYHKTAMFTKRTINPIVEITSADTSVDALKYSLNFKGIVDLDYMAELTGISKDDVILELKEIIFQNPLKWYNNPYDGWETADEYLSGNVRNKLMIARQYAEQQPERFTVNVESLEKVQPARIEASDIEVSIGAPWTNGSDEDKYYQKFMYETFSTPAYAVESPYRGNSNRIIITYNNFDSSWYISNKGQASDTIKARETYGTNRLSAYEIFERLLNHTEIVVKDKVDDTHYVKNIKETIAAQEKATLISDTYREWIFAEPKRRENLVEIYNRTFNSVRNRVYDGSFLTFPQLNPDLVPYDHQANAIARILLGGNTLLAHCVGAGKTNEMVIGGHELKRLGLSNKIMYVVPNHLTGQFGSDYLDAYPFANILVATKKDFERKNRIKFVSRIATGDFDAIVIGHSQFEKIPMSLEHRTDLIREQIEDITDGIVNILAEEGDRTTIKSLERTKKSLNNQLEKLLDGDRKDDVINFEDLGVDYLFVDEAHYYKNLFLYTKMRNIAGIPQTAAQKSSDMYMKIQYLNNNNNGRAVTFATGTPVSNSMTELYTTQRYLQMDTLREKGLQHFDAWAATFGQVVSSLELSPTGTGYRIKQRFARFTNLPELMNMYCDIADIQTAEMLKLPVPEAEFHTISTPASDELKEIMAELVDRADAVKNRRVTPKEDNNLKITNDGRYAGTDIRLLDEYLPDNLDSKINLAINNIYDIWQNTSNDRLAQLVFLDLSTPKKNAFNLYDDIRNKLMKKGIPDTDIAFMQSAKTDLQKADLFADVRSGKKRVLLGSTATCGAGTNIQNKLVAEHHVDVPWRPSDMAQREGRIIRKGNTCPKVGIYRYVTKGSFDAYMWQTLENKQRFISQLFARQNTARSMEDMDMVALSYAEIKAIACDNPLIKEKMEIDLEIKRLQTLKGQYNSQKYRLQDNVIIFYPKQINECKRNIENSKNDNELYFNNETPDFEIIIDGKKYIERDKAAEALTIQAEAVMITRSTEQFFVGKYRGFKIGLTFKGYGTDLSLSLHGKATYRNDMSSSPLGNITRIENLGRALEKRVISLTDELKRLEKDLDDSKTEIEKPFTHEGNLKALLLRQTQLNSELDIDKNDNNVIEDGEDKEQEAKSNTRGKEYEAELA